MERIYIKAAEGLKVRQPTTGLHLPDEGLEVTLDTYWQRRLNDNEVVIAEPPKQIPAARQSRNNNEG